MRIIDKMSIFIDYIIFNFLECILYIDVFFCFLVSDCDVVYVIINIKVVDFK